MCTWCIHSWANLKYQDWFGKHCADPKCVKCYVLQNWNHIYLRALIKDKGKKNILSTMNWFIWSLLLQYSHICFVCLCLSKYTLSFNPFALSWANILSLSRAKKFTLYFWTSEPLITLPLFEQIFVHVVFFEPISFFLAECSLCLAPSGRYISVKVGRPPWNNAHIAMCS